MYNNASTSEKALWRLRPLVEAFGIEVPDGPMDLTAEDFVGQFAMCSTYKDRYNGKVSIKPEDFWPPEGDIPGGEGEAVDLDDISDADIKKVGKAMGIKSKAVKTIRAELEDADPDELTGVLVELGLVEDDGAGEGEGEGIDLDELDDDDIKAIAEAAGIKSKVVKTLRKKLAELDADELAEAAEEAGVGGEGEGEGDAEGFDLDEASDDDIKALAEAAGIKGKIVKKLRAALAELDPDDLAEAVEEAGLGEGDGEGVTADAINAMNQEELEELIEEHDLEVDLDEHKTLRKKRTAVVDAAEEADILVAD